MTAAGLDGCFRLHHQCLITIQCSIHSMTSHSRSSSSHRQNRQLIVNGWPLLPPLLHERAHRIKWLPLTLTIILHIIRVIHQQILQSDVQILHNIIVVAQPAQVGGRVVVLWDA